MEIFYLDAVGYNLNFILWAAYFNLNLLVSAKKTDHLVSFFVSTVGHLVEVIYP